MRCTRHERAGSTRALVASLLVVCSGCSFGAALTTTASRGAGTRTFTNLAGETVQQTDAVSTSEYLVEAAGRLSRRGAWLEAAAAIGAEAVRVRGKMPASRPYEEAGVATVLCARGGYLFVAGRAGVGPFASYCAEPYDTSSDASFEDLVSTAYVGVEAGGYSAARDYYYFVRLGAGQATSGRDRGQLASWGAMMSFGFGWHTGSLE